jgi:enoyl-CoA hydratase/carnithine racemase
MQRPPVNALDADLIARLDSLLDQVLADPEVTLLHLRSEQKVFCAGADLALMQSCFSSALGTDAMVDLVRRMQRLYSRIEAAPIVSLAEIGGAAMGGGLELALACDLRVASLEAKLGLPEVRLGLLPAAGGTQRLSRLCGHGTASRLILGAEIVDGAEALHLGIVQWARPREELAGWTRELASRIAGMPKAALAAGKCCIFAAGDPARNGYAEEIEATQMLYDHPETRTRVSEFLAKTTQR